jgi:hypothetical protein
MKQTKLIRTPSFFVYSLELIKAGKEGWDIDENYTPVSFLQHECGLVREVDVNNPPKMTPAERMEKARAARAEKAAAKAAEKENV